MGFNYRVIQAAWKTAKLARANSKAFAVYLDNQLTTQDNETLITIGMHVCAGIAPGAIGVVVPDLERI
jgi:hypothetical protein